MTPKGAKRGSCSNPVGFSVDLVLDFSWTWKIRSHGRRISRFAAAALQLLLATLPGLALELQIHLSNYIFHE